MKRHETVLVLDYGSQYSQLIARRIREQKVFCEILPFGAPVERILARDPRGLVLSGGPESVYDDRAPGIDDRLLASGIPILGICYGTQLLAHRLGGDVKGGGKREYGQAEVLLEGRSDLLEDEGSPRQVWMSHGDEIRRPPEGFRVTGRTDFGAIAAMESADRKIYGLQFHPEVAHTPGGTGILRRFLFDACGCHGDWTMAAFAEEAVAAIRERVGDRDRVICGLSGGVDSTVAALLIHRAIGERLTALFIDTGLLRKDEGRRVRRMFGELLHIPVRHRTAEQRFLDRLKGVTDPEEKRRRVGEVFVRIFEEEAGRVEGIRFLGQGTLYPDRIESASVKGPSVTIKTHHNVGGLPEGMSLDLVEPLRDLFKDEVRALGRELGLDEDLVRRHPFPGPGLSVRIVGEVTPEKVRVLQEVDAIFIDEIRRAGLYDTVSQAFAVLLPVRTVGVMGDMRTYENVVALRSVDTADYMTAKWSRLPAELLARASNRIVNEVRGINRVVYDISSKPPSTIEWE